GQLRCGHLTVDAPAGIAIKGVLTVGPAGVAPGNSSCYTSTNINPVELLRRKELVEVSSFFRQESGIFHVALPIFDVQFSMTNVEVTGDDRKDLAGFHLR